MTPMTAAFSFRVLPKLTTAYYSFVCQHLIESAPCNIKYMFCKNMIPYHIEDVKFFSSNYSIFDSHGTAEFVQEVRPLVSNFDVLPGNLDSGFVPVLAAFDSLGMYPLEFGKFLLTSDIEPRISYSFTFVVGQEILNTDINTYRFSRRMDNFLVRHFAAEHSEPLSCFVLLDSQSLDFTFWDSMQDNRHRTNFAKLNPFVAQKFESRLRISHALDSAFEPRIASFDFDAFLQKFYPIEEVIKSLAKPVRNILQNLAVNLRVMSRTGYLNIFKERIEIIFACCHEFLIQTKLCIVDFLAYLELIKKSYLLFPRRIQTIFIHPQLHNDGILLDYLNVLEEDV